MAPPLRADVKAENFNDLYEFIGSSVRAMRDALNVEYGPGKRNLILPNAPRTVEAAMCDVTLDEDSLPGYTVVNLDARVEKRHLPPIDITKTLSKSYKSTVAAVSPSIADESSPDIGAVVQIASKLDFISDKTHIKSKQILQDLQNLNDYVVLLKNAPHQRLGLPDEEPPDVVHRKRRATGDASVAGKILCYPYKVKRPVPKIRFTVCYPA